jgi:ribonucleoside-diphosphate reductase alpha chain
MAFKSNINPMFRSKFSEDIFNHKYAHEGCETWELMARTVANDVCGGLMPQSEIDQIEEYIRDLKFIPGGRYLYYAGRPNKFFNNCFLLKAEEDSREDWANLSWKAENCLMTGGGIGVDYSVYRGEGEPISRTGGSASGPIPKMMMTNEIGRNVMQGGSRRSALYASLHHLHPDIQKFLVCKNWDEMPVGKSNMTYWDIKQQDFNFPAPLDMTNISVNYGNQWLRSNGTCGPADAPKNHHFEGNYTDPVFLKNVEQAMRTAEPGFSFNFFEKENETLRNACTEVTSEDDSDVCNLASVNVGRIDSIQELAWVCHLATKFLICGTVKAHLPYEKIKLVREKNRRLGLGLMGVHEWFMKKTQKYGDMTDFKRWLEIYEEVSDYTSKTFAAELGVSTPVANRAIAPTGSIGILAGTTTGIEPLFAVAYKRRYLKGKSDWAYQYVVDGTAQEMIDLYGVDPMNIESALDLAKDPERRIAFQANVQDHVDMSISSTINMPSWGSALNNPDTVAGFAKTLAQYAPRLRGFTCYPDGARGGQPLTEVRYDDAVQQLGTEFLEAVEVVDICDITGKGGSCGV